MAAYKTPMLCWGIADGDQLLAVFLEKEVALKQLQYFSHRSPRLVPFIEMRITR